MNKKLASLLLLLPTVALAHDANAAAGTWHSLMHGLTHPLMGVDHFVAIFAIGLWSINSHKKTALAAPLIFLVAVPVGGLLGTLGMNAPMTEVGIIASLVFFGLMMVCNAKADSKSSLLLVAVFASFHGIAHGAEMATTVSAAVYMAGLMLTTAGLLIMSRSISISASKTVGEVALKVSGFVIAATGSLLAFL